MITIPLPIFIIISVFGGMFAISLVAALIEVIIQKKNDKTNKEK